MSNLSKKQQRKILDSTLASALSQSKALTLPVLQKIWNDIRGVINKDRLQYFLVKNKKKISTCCKQWLESKIGQVERNLFVDQRKLMAT